MEDVRRFNPETVVKHFKYNSLTEEEKKENKYLYRIVDIGIDSETKEKVMIYQALYYPYDTYVRPYDMFMSEVDHEKYPNVEQKYRFDVLHYPEASDSLNRVQSIFKRINKITSYRIR